MPSSFSETRMLTFITQSMFLLSEKNKRMLKEIKYYFPMFCENDCTSTEVDISVNKINHVSINIVFNTHLT